MKRIFENLRKKYVRWKRYIKFAAEYFLFEKPRGLDFTMRDKRLLRKSNGLYHGYSKTNEKHLKKIFELLSYDECHCLLDVGCGKGVVLREAVKYPFRKIAGIELLPDICKIAKHNFKVLKLENKVTCMQADAAEFEHYGEYDVFFFFNPFSGKILSKVVDKILESRKDSAPITIIYHNPEYFSVFQEKGECRILHRLYDSLKEYETYIFQMTPGK